MKKRNLIFGFSALAIALCLGALGVNNTTSVAKADVGVAEAAYGSWKNDESVGSQVRGEYGWWKDQKDGSFTLNGVTWKFNYGRTRWGEADSFALLSYGRWHQDDGGEFYQNTILDEEVYNRETTAFGQLAASLIEYETTSGEIDENGNYAAVSAVYNETPVVLTDDIAIYLGGREVWGFAYIRAVDGDVMYDTDEDGVNESVLAEENKWFPLYTAEGEMASFRSTDNGLGTGNKKDYNGQVYRFGKGNHGSWRFNYFKGHAIQVAFGTIAGINPNFAYDEGLVTEMNGIVINDATATGDMVKSYAQRNPAEGGGFCNWIKSTDNSFGITLRQTQEFLTEEDLAVLAETEINSEFTTYTTALSLLNYLNEQAGINTYNTRLSVLVSNNPTTIVVFSAITLLVVVLSALAVYKKRKTHKA